MADPLRRSLLLLLLTAASGGCHLVLGDFATIDAAVDSGRSPADASVDAVGLDAAGDATLSDRATGDAAPNDATAGDDVAAGDGAALNDSASGDDVAAGDAASPVDAGADPDVAIAPDAGPVDQMAAMDSARPDTASLDTSGIDAASADVAYPDLVPPDIFIGPDVLLPDVLLPDGIVFPDIFIPDIYTPPPADAGPIFDGFTFSDATAPDAHYDPNDPNGPPVNIVFVSSETIAPGLLGGFSGAQAICNNAALDAGITGTFVPWLSTTFQGASDRLLATKAQGWIRRDKRPFANTVADIVAGRIYYPPLLDENGAKILSGKVATGTQADGTVASDLTCEDWTSEAETLWTGDAFTSTEGWTDDDEDECDAPMHIYCFGTGRIATVTPVAPSGRIAFISSGTFTPGGAGRDTADYLCQQEASDAPIPAGNYKALLCTGGESAKARFTTDPNDPPWYRPDGVLIAPTAAAFFANADVLASINVTADQSEYVADERVYTGCQFLDQSATPPPCLDWTRNDAGTQVFHTVAHIPLLTELVIVAVAGVAVALLLAKLRLPTLVGLLIAGALVGPGGLALIGNLKDIQALAEVGVVLLLFTIGLEFSLARLRPIAKLVAVGGTLQVVLAVAGTTLVAWLWGESLPRGLFLGFLVALSSTAIVLRALSDRGELQAPHGNFIVGVLIFQDLCVVPMVLIVPILAGQGGATPWLALLIALAKAAAVVAATLLIARLVLPRLLRWVDQLRSREIFVLAVLAVCIGIAWLTSLAGLSLALGAFLAGLVLADTDFRERALGDVLPLRHAFTSLFFISLGMLFDPRAILEQPADIALLFGAFVVGKGAVAIAAAMAMRFPARVAWLAGAGLAQFGEFGFVLVTLGAALGLISTAETQVIITAGVLSMLVTPLWLKIAPKLTAGEAMLRPLERLLGVRGIDEPSPEHVALRDHVVVVGYGIGGRLLTQALHRAGAPYLVLEMNAETVRHARAEGEPVYYGDVSSPEALQHAGVDRARVIVLLINDPDAVHRALVRIRDCAPQIPVMVRTRFVAHAPDLRAMGVDEVVCEDLEAGVEVLARVRQHLDSDPDGDLDLDVLRGLRVDSLLVRAQSFGNGKRLLSLLEDRAGLVSVTLQRQGRLIGKIDPDDRLQTDDVVFLLGDREAVNRARTRLATGEPGAETAAHGESQE